MTVTLKSKTELVVPDSVRRRAGIKTGDTVEFKVSGGVIKIIPKPSPVADEYTPAQRRIVDREIAKGLEDVKKGRTFGPFSTADQAVAFLRKEIRARKSKQKSR